jgi:hypothetical protein
MTWLSAEVIKKIPNSVTVSGTYSGAPIIWRAPSSPHLACGLNASSFLRFCTLGMAKPARGCRSVSGPLKTFRTLRGWLSFQRLRLSAWRGVFLRWLGKRVRFSSDVSDGAK